MTKTLRILSGFHALADDYDGFLLDIWGVIHDGVALYDGVLPCLKEMKRLGKKIAFLSNAPRRAHFIAEQLAAFGISRDLYEAIITSGEVTHEMLADNASKGFEQFGQNCLQMGLGRYLTLLDGLPYDAVKNLEAADFILCAGPADFASTPETWRHFLREAYERQLPFLCANPDLNVMVGDSIVLCAGSIAQDYEALGGAVTYVGKPHALVYEAASKALAIDKTRLLAVGDSPLTDVRGAKDFGLDVVMIAGGLHSDHLLTADRTQCDEKRITAFFNEYQHTPNAIASHLKW